MQMKHIEENPGINFKSFSIFSALFDIIKCFNHFYETLPELMRCSFTEDSYLWDLSHCE